MTEVVPMSLQLTTSDLHKILREAQSAARRIVRRMRVPLHQIDDIRQDLLVDLFARLPAHDPCRGTLGALVGTILAHQASRLASRIWREQQLFGTVPVSLNEPTNEGDGATRGDLVADNQGLEACFASPADAFARVEGRLDLERALGALCSDDARFCAALCSATAGRLAGKGRGSRSSLYRRVNRIRLELMAAGLQAAA